MFLRLLLLFTMVPLIELYLLIWLGRLTGVGPTIALVIITGVLGAALARKEGLKVWHRIQDQVQRGISPADELLDGLLILLAGAVLITPGLITDVAGFCLLIRPIRRRIRKRLADYFRKHVTIVTPGAPDDRPPYDIVDMSTDGSDPGQSHQTSAN